ncbi:hypothetical protein E4K64_32255 [Bradyrhizobium frederickii]|uniref:Nucleotidyltransferase n=1 Tax=Bradyrhizobium frederickii TaxID=2560054 RepID=A0A4Y9NSF0_9BRAD|nr:hypothetical protein [Bradyrhizobium frederickii]TFV69633.1 hypothetical protein E4K64_32255 [Bradyrhizobium frederickii]
MKLDSRHIVGLPVKLGRDLMRHLNVYRIDVASVHSFFNEQHWRVTVDAARKINPRIPVGIRQNVDEKEYCRIWGFRFNPIKRAEAERVFAALLAEGYLEPNEPEHSRDTRRYQLSRKGRQTAAANLTKRFDRAKADEEVRELIAHANRINTRDELVFYVNKITAFGSYLSDTDDLGDIDLVVNLNVRRPNTRFTEESHYRADNSGKSLDFSSRLDYGRNEVMQLLRARRARLSFASASTVEELKTEASVLFEWGPDTKRRAEMEAFDWRLHEPLRQVKEWLAANPVNSDPVEIARWCQGVADVLSKGGLYVRLFHNWSGNFAQKMMPYWGLPTSQAAAATAHDISWAEYATRAATYITEGYKQTITPVVEREFYLHFAYNLDASDAAILTAERFGWKPAEDQQYISMRNHTDHLETIYQLHPELKDGVASS